MKKKASGWTTTTLICLWLAAGLLAWALTTRPLLIALDWDNAFHLGQIDRLLTLGRPDDCGLGGTLWTCGYIAHMALEPLYGLGASVSPWLGGDTLDGLRAVNALAIATAALCLALVIRRTGAAMPLTILIVLAWLGTAGVLFLIRTLEDDCLSLAWMAVLLFRCTRPPAQWTVVNALLDGAILGAGTLTNYSVVVWAPVIVATAIFAAPWHVPFADKRGLLWGSAVVVGFIVAIALWGFWVTSYDGENWSWTQFGSAVFTSPNKDMSGRDGTVDLFLRYITKNPLDTVLPSGWYPGALLERSALVSRVLPLLLASLVVVGIAWPLRRGMRQVTAAERVVSVSCLALVVCTIPAAWKGDPSQYERMNHVPLCLAALTAAGLSTIIAHSRRLAPVLLAAVVAVPLVNARAVVQAPRGQSWVAHFDALRKTAPRAITFVFAESEFQPNDFDKLTSLGIALPNHLVLSPAGDIRRWPFTPVNHVLLDEYLAIAPDWRRVSPVAAGLIASRRARRMFERAPP